MSSRPACVSLTALRGLCQIPKHTHIPETQARKGEIAYRGMLDAFSRILREEGPRGTLTLAIHSDLTRAYPIRHAWQDADRKQRS
jgi:hypothetical protein